jgi:hypothetical protein
MTFSSVFGFIYAIIKAIPIFEGWLRDFIAFYAVKQREWYEKDLHEAIQKAIASGETSDLERQINSPRAGKPSGDPNSEYDDPDAK